MKECLIPKVLRPYREDDRKLVLASWLPVYWRSAYSPMKWCPLSAFTQHYAKTVEALIKDSFIRVACDPEDESNVLGFAVVRDDMVHWAWSSDWYRRNHLFWYLIRDIADKPMVYTHTTLTFERHIASKLPKWKYRPEALRDLKVG
jgi:hypothetical protein